MYLSVRRMNTSHDNAPNPMNAAAHNIRDCCSPRRAFVVDDGAIVGDVIVGDKAFVVVTAFIVSYSYSWVDG
jgi:hypothetical protein